MLKTFEDLPDLPKDHNALVDFLFNHPLILGEDFKTIKTNFAIDRGIIDLLGKEEKILCLVEVKIDFTKSALSKAKHQLESYARSINNILELTGHDRQDFNFIIARLIERDKLEIRHLRN